MRSEVSEMRESRDIEEERGRALAAGDLHLAALQDRTDELYRLELRSRFECWSGA